jgi:hypothetical protein
MHTAKLCAPRVRSVPISAKTFDAIRTLIFSRSPSAISTPAPIAQLEQRESQPLLEARQASWLALASDEPETFRQPLKQAKRKSGASLNPQGGDHA